MLLYIIFCLLYQNHRRCRWPDDENENLWNIISTEKRNECPLKKTGLLQIFNDT